MQSSVWQIVGVFRSPSATHCTPDNMYVHLVEKETIIAASDAGPLALGENGSMDTLLSGPGKKPIKVKKPVKSGSGGGLKSGSGGGRGVVDAEEDDETEEDTLTMCGWTHYPMLDGRADAVYNIFMKKHKHLIEAEWMTLSWQNPFVCFDAAQCVACKKEVRMAGASSSGASSSNA